MGDSNYPAIDFESNTVDSWEDSDAAKFLRKMQDLFLVQNVTETTRAREGQAPSLLDYIITDEENLVESIEYEDPIGKSDHVCLKWT